MQRHCYFLSWETDQDVTDQPEERGNGQEPTLQTCWRIWWVNSQWRTGSSHITQAFWSWCQGRGALESIRGSPHVPSFLPILGAQASHKETGAGISSVTAQKHWPARRLWPNPHPQSCFLQPMCNSRSPWWLSSKESACQCRRHGFERAPKEGNGNPLQYSYLGNPMDRGAWWATVHGVAKESDTTERLNNNTKLPPPRRSVSVGVCPVGMQRLSSDQFPPSHSVSRILPHVKTSYLGQRSPTLLAPGASFTEDGFSMDRTRRGGMILG